MNDRPDVRAHVVSKLTERLDGRGRFILPPPSSVLPVVPPERARELAVAALRTFGPMWTALWKQRPGVDVDADALVPAPETWFADTPHLPLAERMVREQVHVGPWYVQVFVDREGEPRVVMELSALAHTVAIADGKLADRGVAHEYFRARAAVDPYVVSPEQAVAHLCAATGAKVTEMPSLVRRSGGWAAAMSFWRIALDRPAGVVTTGARWNSAHGRRSVETVIFVGPGLTLNVPAPDQGPVTQIPRLTDGEPGCVDVPLRPGMAQRYDEVVLGG